MATMALQGDSSTSVADSPVDKSNLLAGRCSRLAVAGRDRHISGPLAGVCAQSHCSWRSSTLSSDGVRDSSVFSAPVQGARRQEPPIRPSGSWNSTARAPFILSAVDLKTNGPAPPEIPARHIERRPSPASLEALRRQSLFSVYS